MVSDDEITIQPLRLKKNRRISSTSRRHHRSILDGDEEDVDELDEDDDIVR